MSWTKRQFVEQAFEEIGYASYAFDLEPEQLQSALRKMDGMLAFWNSRGIRIGYPLPSSPQDSSLDDETGVPDAAIEAICSNLAVRLAPTVGKVISPDTKSVAREAYKELLRRAAFPPEQQFVGTLPAGAGTKYWQRREDPFVRQPSDPLDAGGDSELDFD